MSYGTSDRRELFCLAIFSLLGALPLLAQNGSEDAAAARDAEAGRPAESVRVPAGAELREVASPVARVLMRLAEAAELPVLDRSGSWVRVAAGERTGWVDLGAVGEPGAAVVGDGGPAAEGAGAAAAAAGDGSAELLAPAPDPGAELLAAARAALGAGARELAWGRFGVVTDRPDHPSMAIGERIAAALPALHARRYGLEVTEPAATSGGGALLPPRLGTIVLFGRDADYRAVLAALAGDLGATDLEGHAGGGVAALPLGGRTARQAAATLIHEIGHLLNQRALGDGLPAWLDEGMAGDLELVEVGGGGELIEARWAEGPAGYRGRRTRAGPLIALDRLLADAARDRLETLPDLMALDRPTLVASPRRAELYALAALWVRFLLDEPVRAAGFRRWLATLAASDPPPADGGAALLARALGTDLATQERPFRRWLQDIARRH